MVIVKRKFMIGGEFENKFTKSNHFFAGKLLTNGTYFNSGRAAFDQILTNLINILVGILLIIAILLMIIIPDNSDLPTLFALLAFTIYSIPGILKKKVSGWVLGILGLIFIILFLIEF